MMPARPHLLGLLAGLFLSAGLVLSAMLATTTWLKVRNSQFISVKGSARKDIRSDLVIWKGSFVTEAPTLLAAQKNLKADAGKVEQFLRNRGITNIVFAPIAIGELTGTITDSNGVSRQLLVGYRLTGRVRVESQDIGQTQRLDNECADLVEAGVLFTTEPPRFLYTKAGDDKIEMLAEATRDARARAEQIAAQGGRGLAGLHDAEMGIFQITPKHDGQTSWEGMNDTTSVDKTITAVVTATFALK
jgi:uncharacterized protein